VYMRLCRLALRHKKLLSLNRQEVDVEINEQIKVDFALTPTRNQASKI
jgi:hypothetical protein